MLNNICSIVVALVIGILILIGVGWVIDLIIKLAILIGIIWIINIIIQKLKSKF